MSHRTPEAINDLGDYIGGGRRHGSHREQKEHEQISVSGPHGYLNSTVTNRARPLPVFVSVWV